jgi:UDP-GlcNAc:undecaprenyl-phosphate GlcNAc-1-phosphate transferase
MLGKYRQVWRVLGPTELFNLVRGLLLGVAASIIALLYLSRFEGYSRSVFLVDALTAPTLVIGARVALGAIDHYLRLRRRSSSRAAIIIGAGRGGVLALHELLQNAELDLKPVGFIDDDPHKRRQRIEGVPVLGSRANLANILRREKVTCVVVSIRDLPRAAFDEICLTCREQGVDVRRMRFSLEDVEWREQPSGVVRFPGAG